MSFMLAFLLSNMNYRTTWINIVDARVRVKFFLGSSARILIWLANGPVGHRHRTISSRLQTRSKNLRDPSALMGNVPVIGEVVSFLQAVSTLRSFVFIGRIEQQCLSKQP